MREMTHLIRSACLTHYADVARSVGIEPTKMLRKVRLPLASLNDPNMRIAVNSVRRLAEASAAAAGIEDFGLRMAERGGLPNLGSLGLVVREQATLRAAIEALARFVHIHDEALRLEIEHQDDVVTIALFLRSGPQGATRQATEWAVGTVNRTISFLFGDDWRPLEVHFMHSPPRDRRFHRNFFRCNVVFDSEFDAILCAASDMNRPIPSAHPTIARYIQSSVEAIDPRPENWDDKVGELVRSLLPSGRCTIEHVAEHLACDRRTVHRHLLDRGTSFSAILDEQRANLVARLIEDGNRPLAGIAELLGFSAQSAMARWFRGHFGCSITQWRSGGRPPALTVGAARGAISRSRPAKKPGRASPAHRRSKKLER
jgi:AraC-like DNA-binding protein